MGQKSSKTDLSKDIGAGREAAVNKLSRPVKYFKSIFLSNNLH